MQKLREESIDIRPLAWNPNAFYWPDPSTIGKTVEHAAGLYWVQEEAALLPVLLLDIKRGMKVLDLCAAPGNKSAQIAIALGDEGIVVANDINPKRTRSLGGTINRLGLTNVIRTHCDGVKFPRPKELFDRVLVDVPCSCLGTCRKSPSVLKRHKKNASHELSIVQGLLLKRAFELCKMGGIIVYSTCTFDPLENESVISLFLKHHPHADLIDAKVEGFNTSSGIISYENMHFDPRMSKTMRVWPHEHDTGGFYCAKITKTHEI